MATNPASYLSEEQYLELERKNEIHHEYLRGEIFAMSGGTADHSSLAVHNLAAMLSQIDDGPCQAFNSDLRVRVAASGLYTYPDISVVRGEPLFRDDTRDPLLNPVLIVEVLSQSTASYDRGEKFRHYQSIPTLQTYILVSSDRVRVERFTRAGTDTWTYRASDGLDAVLAIETPPLTIPLQSIYRRLVLPDN